MQQQPVKCACLHQQASQLIACPTCSSAVRFCSVPVTLMHALPLMSRGRATDYRLCRPLQTGPSLNYKIRSTTSEQCYQRDVIHWLLCSPPFILTLLTAAACTHAPQRMPFCNSGCCLSLHSRPCSGSRNVPACTSHRNARQSQNHVNVGMQQAKVTVRVHKMMMKLPLCGRVHTRKHSIFSNA